MSLLVQFTIRTTEKGRRPELKPLVGNNHKIRNEYLVTMIDSARGIDSWVRRYCQYCNVDMYGNSTTEMQKSEIERLSEACQLAINKDEEALDALFDCTLDENNPKDVEFYNHYLKEAKRVCDTFLQIMKDSTLDHTLTIHISR